MTGGNAVGVEVIDGGLVGLFADDGFSAVAILTGAATGAVIDDAFGEIVVAEITGEVGGGAIFAACGRRPRRRELFLRGAFWAGALAGAIVCVGGVGGDDDAVILGGVAGITAGAGGAIFTFLLPAGRGSARVGGCGKFVATGATGDALGFFTAFLRGAGRRCNSFATFFLAGRRAGLVGAGAPEVISSDT
ncbi:hypothetical protein FACS1894139_08040 [Planctomycetales bacterium]|nr:hypothetical protein FACS1894107_00220 [Planctomycetales bacterium]GHS96252.1 hypothetical protein FACS1894108_00560 [Planctomycetales bacterium]GHT04986.1 hypothetical protein FACS1894139_08040 [Planctomycetales bacterium]